MRNTALPIDQKHARTVVWAAILTIATTGAAVAEPARESSAASATQSANRAAGANRAKAPVAAGDNTLFAELDRNNSGAVTRDEVPEEHHRLFARLVRRGDADENGELTADELAKALTPSSDPKPIEQSRTDSFPGARASRLLLLKLDTNRDSTLTRSEAPQKLRGVFDQISKQVDRNKNKELDRGELARGGRQLARRADAIARRMGWDVETELKRIEAKQGEAANRFERRIEPLKALRDPKQAASLFKQLDANGDRRLVVSELPERLQERVGRLLKRADTNRDGGVSQKEFVAASSRLARFLDKP